MVETTGYIPAPGDFVWVSFSPQAGHEQRGRRPGLVVSRSSFNKKTGFAWVCPITNEKKGYAFEVDVPTGSVTGVILADQVRSLDYRARHFELIETAPSAILKRVVQLAKVILASS